MKLIFLFFTLSTAIVQYWDQFFPRFQFDRERDAKDFFNYLIRDTHIQHCQHKKPRALSDSLRSLPFAIRDFLILLIKVSTSDVDFSCLATLSLRWVVSIIIVIATYSSLYGEAEKKTERRVGKIGSFEGLKNSSAQHELSIIHKVFTDSCFSCLSPVYDVFSANQKYDGMCMLSLDNFDWQLISRKSTKSLLLRALWKVFEKSAENFHINWIDVHPNTQHSAQFTYMRVETSQEFITCNVWTFLFTACSTSILIHFRCWLMSFSSSFQLICISRTNTF